MPENIFVKIGEDVPDLGPEEAISDTTVTLAFHPRIWLKILDKLGTPTNEVVDFVFSTRPMVICQGAKENSLHQVWSAYAHSSSLHTCVQTHSQPF